MNNVLFVEPIIRNAESSSSLWHVSKHKHNILAMGELQTSLVAGWILISNNMKSFLAGQCMYEVATNWQVYYLSEPTAK